MSYTAEQFASLPAWARVHMIDLENRALHAAIKRQLPTTDKDPDARPRFSVRIAATVTLPVHPSWKLEEPEQAARFLAMMREEHGYSARAELEAMTEQEAEENGAECTVELIDAENPPEPAPDLLAAIKTLAQDGECYCADHVSYKGPCGHCAALAAIAHAERNSTK